MTFTVLKYIVSELERGLLPVLFIVLLYILVIVQKLPTVTDNCKDLT